MGKNKAQRTKNNARPSSSGRSAQLLDTSATFSTSQEGFGAPLPSFVGISNLTLDDSDSQTLNAQTQLVLKKLNKKDAITRLKGLQELSELCVEAEEQEIKTILKLWPRMFCSLSTDPDHRVREATFAAHKQLAKRAGRNLAPVLKGLSGPWFVGQFDTFAPAASSAKAAFQEAFPGSKYQEAVKYCQSEIMAYICENLLSQTVETVAYERSLNPDELEARMERVLSSNLQGYKLLVTELPAGQLKLLTEANAALTSSNKFWKLSKHKSPVVRRAWFTALATVLHTADFLIEGQSAHTMPAIFGSLDESDPTVLSSVWDAALCAVIAIKDCWSHVNCEKVVFPKLWHILREGGYGNAASIFPNMLPLVSKVAPQDQSAFCSKFFSNMLIGLGQKTVQQSMSECGAIVTAYVECLRYLVGKEDAKESKELMIKQQMLPLLDTCILEPKLNLSINPLALQLTDLLDSWSDTPLSDVIWKHFHSLLSDFCENADLNYQSFMELLVLLAQPSRIKKARQVNFAPEENEEGAKKIVTPQITNTSKSDKYWKSLGELSKIASFHILEAITDAKQPAKLISTLHLLSKVFKGEDFFKSLKPPTIMNFYEVLSQLLSDGVGEKRQLVQIIFMLFEFISKEEKTRIYDDISKVADRGTMLIFIEEAINLDHQGEKTVVTWLRGATMSEVMITLAKEVSNMLSTTEKHKSLSWLILKLCFSPSMQWENDIFASFSTVTAIMLIFCEALAIPKTALDDRATLESYANFIGHLTSSLFNQQFKLCEKTLQELLLGTFKLCCSSVGLSQSAYDSLQKALVSGVQHLQKSGVEIDSLIKKFASTARQEFSFLNTKPVLCIADFLATFHSEEVFQLFMSGQPKYEGWKKQLEEACVLNEIVQGLYWPENKKVPIATSVDCVFDFTVETLLKANLLLRMLELEESNANCSDSEEGDPEPIFKHTDMFKKELISVLGGYVTCEKTASSFKNNSNCSKVSVDIQLLKSVMESIWKKLPQTQIQSISENELERLQRNQYPSSWTVLQLCSWDKELPEKLCSALSTSAEVLVPWRMWLFQSQSLPLKEQVFELFYDEGHKLLEQQDPMCAHYYSEFQSFKKHLEDVDKLTDLIVRWNKLDYWKSVFNDDLALHNKFIAVIKFLARLMEIQASKLQHHQWDTILCSLAGYLQDAKKHLTSQPTNPLHAAKLVALCPLVKNIQYFMKILEKGNGVKVRVANTDHLLDEWRALFVPEFFSILMSFFYNSLESTVVPIFEQSKMCAVGACLASVPESWLVTHLPPKHLIKQHKLISNQDKHVQDMVLVLVPLLHSNDRNIKVTAYHLLKKLLKELVRKDEEYLLSVETDNVDIQKLSCELFGPELAETHTVVEAMLMDFRVGDCCIVQPFTDSHLYTYAYLLTWSLLLDMCKESKSELRYQFSCWLNNGGYTKTMVEIVFRLMPDFVIQPFHINSDRAVSKEASEMFTHEHSPSYEGTYTSGSLMKMACWIYLKSLLHLPALVRDWWTELDPQNSGLVERLTSTLVSKHVIGIEMKSVLERKESCTTVEIKVHPLAREVIATYTIDEVRMELTVTLPANHPLGPIKVEGNNTIDISKWKQWVKQLTIFLTRQNGSIWDGLMLWKRNLDKKFQGVEECYICYSILHSSNYQIPKLSCRTCHKKFHSSCLYRWFHTSNNSTCPLCRNLF